MNSPKTKGQQPLVAKLELLALCLSRGGVAEWSNATGLQPANGALIAVRGFESLPRRQNSNCALAEPLTSTRARTAQPKPYESLNLSIRLLAVDLKEIHSDMPFMPDRSREGR